MGFNSGFKGLIRNLRFGILVFFQITFAPRRRHVSVPLGGGGVVDKNHIKCFIWINPQHLENLIWFYIFALTTGQGSVEWGTFYYSDSCYYSTTFEFVISY